MKFLVIFLAVFSLTAFAQDFSGSACSTTTSVCATYRSDLEFAVGKEGRFTLDLKSTDTTAAEMTKIYLWMEMAGGHGHKGSPLKVTSLAPGQYDITKAYFSMRGEWQIRVTYRSGSVEEQLTIPVIVK